MSRPELLDMLDVATVRVVEKRAGETQIQPLAAGQREAVRRGLLSLGEVLRTEGLQQQSWLVPGGGSTNPASTSFF